MPPVVQIAGHASKRGLVPRQPSAERLLADIEQWLANEYPEIVRSSRSDELPSGDRELRVGFHPAAHDVSISASDGGRVTLSAVTSPVGPGYHRFVSRLAERLASEQSIAWGVGEAGESTNGDGPAPLRLRTGSPTEAAEPAFDDRPTAERSYLTWLGNTLVSAADARRRGAPSIHVDTPAGVRYGSDGALATILGPRDDGWLQKAVSDPRVAIDVAAWWADATDARYLLNRALCLMWTEVRWRQPVDQAERDVLDEVARLLWRAFPLDPSLDYPWREWAEVLDLRGVDEPAGGDVRERAESVPADRPLIGYRRQPVTVLHEGWSLEIPGSFAERRGPEEWWGGESGRNVTLAAVETGTEHGPMPAEAFLRQVAADLDGEALTHQAGELIGRARLGTDASSGVEVGVVEGYSAIRGRGAAIRVVFEDPADWQWALDMWRGLAPA